MDCKPEATPKCDVPALWLQHKEALVGYIRKRVRDEDAANDLLQEVLMKIYNFCLARTGVQNVRSWLFQIAQNSITDYYRRQARISYEVPEELAEEDEQAAYKDAAELILPMLGFLPEEYAVPVKLSDLDGLKQAEVAERLGLTLSAAKSRIQRGRQLLKAEFITCCHLDTDQDGNLVSISVKDSCHSLQEYLKTSGLKKS